MKLTGKGMQKALQLAGGGAAGVIGASALTGALPVAGAASGLIKIVGGVFLIAQKNSFIKGAGVGMAGAGTLDLIKEFAPDVATQLGIGNVYSPGSTGVYQVSNTPTYRRMGQYNNRPFVMDVST